MKPILKQVRAEGGCISFVLADARSRRACLIDPRADELETYAEFLETRKLKAVTVIDTHTHADHYSGSHLVARDLGAVIAMSEHTRSERAGLRLRDGQSIEVGGELAIEVLHTPGHTPDSVCLLLKGPWGQLVFTGDTLFIGGSGRTDFPGADPALQYDSIYRRLGGLADATWVLPGHDYSNLLFSTIGHERRTNPHWLFRSREEFVRAKSEEALSSGGIVAQVVEFNLSATPVTAPRAGAVTMCASACARDAAPVGRESPERFRELLAGSARMGGGLFIDVREPEEYARGHIPKTRNIPISELLLHWEELKNASAVYFNCAMGGRSLAAARSVRRLGLENVGDLLGGFSAWLAREFPVAR